MILTEAEARERLRRSPLNAFTLRFKNQLTETAPDRAEPSLSSESNLESMLRASLNDAKETETSEAQTETAAP